MDNLTHTYFLLYTKITSLLKECLQFFLSKKRNNKILSRKNIYAQVSNIRGFEIEE